MLLFDPVTRSRCWRGGEGRPRPKPFGSSAAARSAERMASLLSTALPFSFARTSVRQSLNPVRHGDALCCISVTLTVSFSSIKENQAFFPHLHPTYLDPLPLWVDCCSSQSSAYRLSLSLSLLLELRTRTILSIMATAYEFARTSKLETRDLDSEYVTKQHRGADDITTKHVRVDSKVRQVWSAWPVYRIAHQLTPAQ